MEAALNGRPDSGPHLHPVSDLRVPEGAAAARRVAGTCDAVMEGFRPGVAERLGLGPDQLASDNPALVYGRMTGWGQSGPLSQTAGHDITYLAISGLLHGIGSAAWRPVPPVNYVADFGGDAMFLVARRPGCTVARSRDG